MPPQLVAEPLHGGRSSPRTGPDHGAAADRPLPGQPPARGGSGSTGRTTAKVQIIDGCDLSGSYWTVAAAVTDEPLELVITDPQAGTTVSQLLWTDRESVSRLADTASLPSCP